MATQLANIDEIRQATASLNNQLQTRAEQFRMVLPAHIAPEQFQRTIITAVQSDPDLLKADRQSLLLSCMKAAQDGLLPDKREAALVIFRVKQGDEWVKQVQYMPMVFGLRKKILQSGEISTIETNVVYRRELESGAFIYEAGTEAVLRHRPMLELTDEETADSEIVAAYSVAVMKDGTRSFEVMRRSEINKVRQASQTGAIGRTKYKNSEPIPPKGPWVDWFSEMARKTVMRRHSKTLPMSGDLIDVEARDEELAARSTQAALAMAEPDAPRLVPPTRGEEQEEIEESVQRDLDRDSLRQMDGIDADPPANDGTLADDNPAATEGRADPDHGSQHDGATTDSETKANALIERLVRASVASDVTGIEDELLQHQDGMDFSDVRRVDAEAKAARTRLRMGERK